MSRFRHGFCHITFRNQIENTHSTKQGAPQGDAPHYAFKSIKHRIRYRTYSLILQLLPDHPDSCKPFLSVHRQCSDECIPLCIQRLSNMSIQRSGLFLRDNSKHFRCW